MAAGRDFYSVERRGHRDGYDLRDVDGRLLSDYGLENVWKDQDYPKEILTAVDVDDVWRRWKTALPVSSYILFHSRIRRGFGFADKDRKSTSGHQKTQGGTYATLFTILA